RSMKTEGSGLFRVAAGSLVGRRRAAPRSEETSDVRRFRGVATGIVLGAVGALGIWYADPEPSRRGPGPLAWPHRQAGLTCASCHLEDAPVAAGCVGCHGAHPSARAGHQRLRETGRLDCADCHRIHRDFGGVSFASGEVTRFIPGYEVEVDGLEARVHTRG